MMNFILKAMNYNDALAVFDTFSNVFLEHMKVFFKTEKQEEMVYFMYHFNECIKVFTAHKLRGS